MQLVLVAGISNSVSAWRVESRCGGPPIVVATDQAIEKLPFPLVDRQQQALLRHQHKATAVATDSVPT
jgi:hypothetical protein